MTSKENQLLIEKLIHGEEKAYMFLLEMYHRQLNAYAITLTHNKPTAEDIVQNVFLKTWKSRKKLNPKLPIRSFLYKCVYNEFLNHYQKNKAVILLQAKYIEYAHQVVEETDSSGLKRMIEIVDREIKKLPPKCQKVFILSKREGLTNTEIADYMNVSIKTVEAQITKAFRLLKSRLEEKHAMALVLIFRTNFKNV